jgi:hypothetical protein
MRLDHLGQMSRNDLQETFTILGREDGEPLLASHRHDVPAG